MRLPSKLDKKGVGWPYVVALIIGILVLIVLFFIMFKGKNWLAGTAGFLEAIFS